MTEHDDDAGPQDFDEEDPASAPESDPDPLLPLTVENRLGAVLDHAGSMVGRAHERGLLFYPGQNRGFLVRKILHPGVNASTPLGRPVRIQVPPGVIRASDAGVPDDHVPMGRNIALEHPPPAIRIQVQG